MTRLRHFGEATPILRYFNWVAAALVTHTAIHHWIVLDIRRVIERDEAMPISTAHQIPNVTIRQTEQDGKVGSLECCNVADLESLRSSVMGCWYWLPTAFRVCAVRLAMPLAETIR